MARDDNREVAITIIDTSRQEIVRREIIGKLAYFQSKGTFSEFSPYASIHILRDPDMLLIWNPYLPSPTILNIDEQGKYIPYLLEYETSSLAMDLSKQLLFLSNDDKDTIMLIRYFY